MAILGGGTCPSKLVVILVALFSTCARQGASQDASLTHETPDATIKATHSPSTTLSTWSDLIAENASAVETSSPDSSQTLADNSSTPLKPIEGSGDGDAIDTDEPSGNNEDGESAFEPKFDWGEISIPEQGSPDDAADGKDVTEVLWKVPLFSELASESLPVVLSPKFYTSRPGFRLQLLLIPNSTYSDATSYLGLFFRLVTGLYDAQILWPYELKTEMSLIDQSRPGARSPKNISFTVTPNRDACRLRSAFLRPSYDTDNSFRPDGCGNRRHVDLEELNNSLVSGIGPQYIVNDTVLIRTRISLKDIGEAYETAQMSMKYNTLVSEHVWAIDKFPAIQADSLEKESVAVLTSQPFYTHSTGYLVQMFLTLLPRKRAFAISTSLVQGDFDRNLEWPFPHQIEVAIIDQSPDYWRRDYSIQLDASSADCGSAPFFQPGLSPEFCFVTVQSLELLTLTHYNFIRNGTLKIRFMTKLNAAPRRKTAALSVRDGWMVAEYSWLVPEIENKLNRFDYSGRRIKTFISDRFYTNQQGYLMQMVLQLNHTDKRNGSMGLELTILEGENDGILSWPFNLSYELMIINQRPEIIPGEKQQTISNDASKPGDIIVHVEPSTEVLCPRHSFTKPIERNPSCGRKNLVPFARVSRSTDYIRLGSLLVKARIRLAKIA